MSNAGVVGSIPIRGSKKIINKLFMSDREVVYRGPGILGMLGIAFVVLKLAGIIDWSWWWVTAPFWGPVALVIGIIVLVLLIMGIVGMVSTLLYVCRN